MFFKFLFKQWPLHKQVSFLKKKGILIGSRTREGRKIYIYMYRDHFAEVLFKNDNPDHEIEHANIVRGLKDLNTHLEKDFKTTF
jgi:hypothetical protein